MSAKEIFALLKEAFKAWQEDKAGRLGAALAYYTIFAIGPLLLIVIAIVGFFFGRQAVQGQIQSTVSGVVGDAGAEIIQTMVQNASSPSSSIVASIIGVITLILAASGFFGHLQDSLNTIWGVTQKPGAGFLATITARFLSFTMVLGVGFLLLVSLVINALLAVLSDFLRDYLPGGTLVWQAIGFVVSLAIVILLFAMIYKVLPDVHIAWRDVWVGAIITAILFTLGQVALGFYLSFSNVGSAYGAAGSLVIILVWIYYSSQILFFGAELTQVYANKYGADIRPAENAIFVTLQERAEQGLSPSKDGARKERARGRIGAGLASPWFK